ncbi:tudor domain-containing protein 3 [Venturia canescens]|uniref:tudor domain-containing protein 3 n=1 Tax=Venturia canescens TaxID=32260 RepID=UPI001C9C4D61|nr:tudor domain-containing protein 3 [Venturia canescens]
MQKLQEQGWYLSEQGYEIVSDAGSINDLQKIIKRSVDLDLREIGSGQGDITNGNLVLQIQKLRNIAAPKYNEESRTAPRMLKLSLTDGKNNYQAVEIDHISGLGLNTPPGTKVLLKSGNVLLSHGIILLSSKNIARVLGGKVPNLVEKWELNRKLATHSRLRSVEEGGPPPWIPFGKKIIKGGIEKDKNFKALGKDSDKETTEFEAQRQDAIAEAARLGGKKIFGGGNKQLLDHSVQRIVDQGFTVEQAEYALKISRNHVERALKSLQRTNDSRSTSAREPRETREPRGKRFEKKTEETKPSSGKVSLFDFLEDKLPAQSDVPETQSNFQQQYQRSNENSNVQRLENQFERLELRGSDHSQAGKGGRAQRGGRGYPTAPRHANDESKYPKRSSHESHNSFPTSNTFGNVHQTRPPRFQRNQDFHGNHHAENSFKSNNSKPQGNERKNNSTTFGQSRGEFGVFNSIDSSTYTNKNLRSHDEIAKNQHTDSRYKQSIETEPKNKHISGYDAPHGKQNRGQHETLHKTHAGALNAIDKNYKNQSNRPQHSVASNELYKNNHGNNRNPDNESAGGNWVWKLGDDCMAKYWEDNRYYNAQVTAISATTCVVRFKDFNNHEEVLQVDCIPITDKPQEYSEPELSTRRNDQRGYGNRQNRNDHGENHISGMEFRRSGGGGVGGGGNIGQKGYNRKRGQQRSAQPIYQPPAQRAHSSSTWTANDNPPI